MEQLFPYLQGSFTEGLLIALAVGILIGVLATLAIRRRR